MGAGIRNAEIPKEKIDTLRMYTYSLADSDVIPWNIPSIRESLKDYEEIEEVIENDIWLLEDLKEILKVNPAIQDDPTQPLEKWWWHLNKIVKGEYPIERLPEHLREIYRERYYKE